MTIRINLLPRREILEQGRKRRALMAGAATLCLAVGTLAAVNLSQHRRGTALESDLAERRRVTGELRLRAGTVKELEETIRRQRERNHAVDTWLRRGARHARVLRGLSDTAPKRLWLTRYTESGGVTTLEGGATGNEPIARFLRRLSPVVNDPRLVEAGAADGEEGVRRFVIKGGNGPRPNPVAPEEPPGKAG